ncbi:MAG: glycosyltransferase family 4 protein [Nitrospirae bacterium]|nr:glycosyltransferase family 4 protein [Nitrospirota bacterium]
MKTAIVHEWLISYAGSERVLGQIAGLYPDADIYSLLDFLPDGERDFIFNKHVNTSFIQKLPMAKEKYRNYLLLMPFAIKRFDLSGYDLIITSSHTVAKGVKKYPGQLHICYCHTPMRYIWDLQSQYLKESGLDRGIRGVILKALFSGLRKWDVATSKNVDHFIANSHYIKERIKKAYGRDSEVIYPPVDIENFKVNEKKEDFFIAVSRMVPYKKMDLIVEAFSEMGLPLIVIGDGPDFGKVKRKAAKNIELMGHLKVDVLKMYMQKARALVFAAEEDFGIVPVEAQACGTPVIAFGKGGIRETVIPLSEKEAPGMELKHPTGIFFNEQTTSALIDAIKRFEKIEERFNPYDLRRNAEKFSKERFDKEFRNFINGKTAGFSNKAI